MTTPILDFVRGYAATGTVRFHMPGHKGRGPLGCEAGDLTEIQGADELYEAEGIIAESEANATALFGTAHTYYSTEGSSQCIRAMLALALRGADRAPGQRPVLLAARNAHKALLYAAALLDFDVRWLWPAPEAAGALCSCPVTPAGLEAALAAGEGQPPFAVYVTSPDYLGGVQDIAGLAAVCRAHGLPLLVDNAHGAYLHFLPGGSRHPIALGAAMCCDSGHKTLPVLTGGAYLHLGPDAPVQEESVVRNTLNLFGSTSPSYLILQSLDAANAALAGEWPRQLADRCARLEALRAACNAAFPGFVRGGEPLKLTLDGGAVGYSGGELAAFLRGHGIEPEYADPRFVVLMASPGNTPEELTHLRETLLALPRRAPQAAQEDAALFRALEREQAQCPPRCTIRQAIFAPQEPVEAAKAVGRVCAMPTVSCPPAIPITVSGEVVTPAAARLMERYGIRKIAVRSEF